jgi:prepilin-type N-terminal cleavage/methylation domain-containing protein
MTMKRNPQRSRKSQSGMTLVETVMALAILLIVSAGVMVLAVIAVSTTETQGHLAARTAEYAQDKMEQLMALNFCDGGAAGNQGTDTTVFPSVFGAGTGLGGCTGATIGNVPPAPPPTPLTGGSLNTAAPAAGYVDYLDVTGNLVTAGQAWEYIRVWQISIPPGSVGLEQISVCAQARYSVGSNGLNPTTTVVAMKTFPF